jgi:excisionase family DNA binding protein
MKRAYPVDGFCREYGVGKTLTYRLIKEGRLKAVKVDSKTLIRHDDAEAWLASLAPLPTEDA